MTEGKPKRLSVVARDLNVGTTTIIQFLANKGYVVENNPNAKVPLECLDLLDVEFKDSKSLMQKAIKNSEIARENKEINISAEKQAKQTADVVQETTQPQAVEQVAVVSKEPKAETKPEIKEHETVVEAPIKERVLGKHEIIPLEKSDNDDENSDGPKVLGTINLDEINQKTRPKKKSKAEKDAERKSKESEQKALKDEKKRKPAEKTELKKLEKVSEAPKETIVPTPVETEVKKLIK